MKKNNKILYISIAILVLAVGVAFGTFAYYQTTITGTISGTVARWSFKANNQKSTFALDFGSLYPGKSGNYDFILSAEDSDLPVYYEFIMHNGASVITEHLAVEFTINGLVKKGFIECKEQNVAGQICGLVGAYGVIPAGEKISFTVIYDWPYDGLDDSSLADGSLVTNDVTVVGLQYDTLNFSDSGMLLPLNLLQIPNLNTSEFFTYSESTSTHQIIPMSCEGDPYGWGSGCLSDISGYFADSTSTSFGAFFFYPEEEQ